MESQYTKFQEDQQKQFNEFSKGKIFYAFNNKQFTEGMQSLGLQENDTDKVIRFFAGGYILKQELANLKKLLADKTKDLQEKMKDYNFAKDAFYSELANHEFCYTYDYIPTLDALCLSLEEVKNDTTLYKALCDAKNEYMKEQEMDT